MKFLGNRLGRIAHDYMGVDPEAVWEIIKWDIPDLERKLNSNL